jgi:hypothetical protein
MAMKDLNSLHKRITREISEEREKEIAEFIAAKREANQVAARKEASALQVLADMVDDFEKLGDFHDELVAESDKELARIKKKYADDPTAPKRIPPEHFRQLGLTAVILPETARLLPPSYAAVFSTKDDEDQLSGGTGTEVYNYTCYDAWCWAKGAGNGWFGSGAGSYQVWAEWGFWFLPPSSRYYSIVPHNVFRGFYIVRADVYMDECLAVQLEGMEPRRRTRCERR